MAPFIDTGKIKKVKTLHHRKGIYMYSDNDKKLYIVVNRNLDSALLFNAACHISAGITRQIASPEFDHYPTQLEGVAAHLSRYPVVILQAKNSGQLAKLVSKAQEEGVLCNFFTTTMLSHSAEQQIADTQNAAFEELEFVAVAVYGEAEQLAPLTKRFSVHK
jgi:hypothetical protein